MFFNKIFGKTTAPVLEKVIGFTERRNAVIADNIANQNTFGYKTRDLDVAAFNRQLIEAITDRARPGRIGRFEMPSSMTVKTGPGGFVEAKVIEDPRPTVLKHNGNNVDAGYEQARLAKNMLLHNAAIELLRKQYSMLRTAITERVG